MSPRHHILLPLALLTVAGTAHPAAAAPPARSLASALAAQAFTVAPAQGRAAKLTRRHRARLSGRRATGKVLARGAADRPVCDTPAGTDTYAERRTVRVGATTLTMTATVKRTTASRPATGGRTVTTATVVTTTGRLTRGRGKLVAKLPARTTRARDEATCPAGPGRIPTPADPGPTTPPKPPATPDAAGARFTVELAGLHRYDWSTHSRDVLSPGTDSSCTSVMDGGGLRLIEFADHEGLGGTARLVGDELYFADQWPMETLVDLRGDMTTIATGRAASCNGTTSWDRSGCADQVVMHDLLPTLSWEAGRMRLGLSDVRMPEQAGRCPIDQPDYGTPLSSELTDEVEAPLSLADLRDPSKREIVVPFADERTGFEDCGSVDGPGCTNDDHVQGEYSKTARKVLEGHVILRRIG